MVSERDFDNVTYVWSCTIVRASLKRDSGLKCQHLSFLCCFFIVICVCLSVAQGKVKPREVKKLCLLFRSGDVIF